MALTHPLVAISRRLDRATAALSFAAPVAYVYRPLDYARAPHELYLSRFGASPKEVLLLGMNPGPFGMMQTGVPFGEVSIVRDWLRVEAPVESPRGVHPRRPVDGFACTRAEMSGARLWGWARQRFGTPGRFFARFFVWNWCPLGFLDEGGRNLTPDKLPARERAALEAPCDRALAEVVAALGPRVVVGVGGFAEAAARRALAAAAEGAAGGATRGMARREAIGDAGALGPAPRIARILHPSPASPAANRGWAAQAEAELAAAGIRLP